MNGVGGRRELPPAFCRDRKVGAMHFAFVTSWNRLTGIFLCLVALCSLIAGCAAKPVKDNTVLSEAAIAELNGFIQTQMEKQRIPGLSLAGVKNGHVVFAQGYGSANLPRKTPASPETVYALGSISKQFTAAAVLLLVQDGKLQLDSAITNYL